MSKKNLSKQSPNGPQIKKIDRDEDSNIHTTSAKLPNQDSNKSISTQQTQDQHTPIHKNTRTFRQSNNQTSTAAQHEIFKDPISKAREHVKSDSNAKASIQIDQSTTIDSTQSSQLNSTIGSSSNGLNTSHSDQIKKLAKRKQQKSKVKKDKESATNKSIKQDQHSDLKNNNDYANLKDSRSAIAQKGNDINARRNAQIQEKQTNVKKKTQQKLDDLKKKAIEKKKQAEEVHNIIEKITNTVKTVVAFIKTFWLPILIVLAILYIIVPLIDVASTKIGNTPHYYCDLEASQGVKSTLAYKQYCTSGSGGNESIAEAAVSLAYNIEAIDQVDTTFVASMCRSGVSHSATNKTGGAAPNDIATQLYVDVHDQVLKGDNYYASCDRGSCTAIRWAGADDTMPAGACDTQVNYLESSEKWEYIGELSSEDQLEPGDVMINKQHIGIYVGEEAVQAVYPGCEFRTYAASYGDHCPQLQDVAHWLSGNSKGKYKIFRNVQPEAASEYKDINVDK